MENPTLQIDAALAARLVAIARLAGMTPEEFIADAVARAVEEAEWAFHDLAQIAAGLSAAPGASTS